MAEYAASKYKKIVPPRTPMGELTTLHQIPLLLGRRL